MPRKQNKAVPEGSGPVRHHDEFGSYGEPTMADLHRMLEENFDRQQVDGMMSHFDRQDKKLDEVTKEIR